MKELNDIFAQFEKDFLIKKLPENQIEIEKMPS